MMLEEPEADRKQHKTNKQPTGATCTGHRRLNGSALTERSEVNTDGGLGPFRVYPRGCEQEQNFLPELCLCCSRQPRAC